MNKLLILAAICGIAFAALEDCSFVGKASQADDGDGTTTYCNADGSTISSGIPKLTVTVAADHGVCTFLEPTLTDEQLEEQFGLELRPLYTGTFTQDGDDVIFSLDQYGDDNCMFIQRHVELIWGEEFCADAQTPSEGRVHDIYFMDAECGGFADESELTKNTEVVNGFPNYALYEPWELLSDLINGTKDITTDNGPMTQSFSRANDYSKERSLCYGLGNEYAPPFFITVLDEDDDGDLVARNALHAPGIGSDGKGWLCNYDCTPDYNEALAVFAANFNPSNPQMAIVMAVASFMNSTCGQTYGLTLGYDPTNPEYAMTAGYPPDRFLSGVLFMDIATPRKCNECYDYSPLSPPWAKNAFGPMNLMGRLGQTLATSDPSFASLANFNGASRFTFCQTDIVMSSKLWIDPDNNDFECHLAGDGDGDSPAATPVALLALALPLLAALRF